MFVKETKDYPDHILRRHITNNPKPPQQDRPKPLSWMMISVTEGVTIVKTTQKLGGESASNSADATINHKREREREIERERER